MQMTLGKQCKWKRTENILIITYYLLDMEIFGKTRVLEDNGNMQYIETK
jgi:hypothetical protein